MSLRARLLAAFTYVLLLATVSFGVPLALSLRARVNAEVHTQAQAQADLVAATAGDLVTPGSHAELGTLVRTAASSLGGRVLIVNASGRVLVDSAGPAELGASYLSRPEIHGALSGRTVQVQRASKTLGKEILATAVPVIHNGRTAGAVRVTQPVSAVHQSVQRAELAIALIGLIVLALGLVVATLLAGQIGRPLRRLEGVARRVAQGSLSARATVEGSREQRSLSNCFNDMTDRIARLVSAQRDFVADASHQLRTPLTGLRLRLEEAKELAAGTDAGRELEAAIGEVDRLSHTVDELLLVSRAGERPLTGTTVNLCDLVIDATERWRPPAAARGITLKAHCESDSGAVWAARADLERALDALLENAVRYSPPGAMVAIASGPGRIEVRDRGPGILPGERELVFERFRRGSTGLAGPEGHGLGLPIARELVREWGGEITVQERDGGGTRAVVSLEQDRQPRNGRERGFARTLPADA